MRMDLKRLTLLIERLLDAELLLDAEGTKLLIEVETARQSLQEGDTQSARRHIEQVARFTEAFVTTQALGLADGCAVIETARRILTSDTD
jgi:hypothetical protein